MLLPDITPGTRRALAATHAWAEALGTQNVDARHVLLGLLAEEEGRPTQLLQQQGVETPSVIAALQVPHQTIAIPDDFPDQLDSYLQQLLYDARLLALEL